jgi:hypothetical protein
VSAFELSILLLERPESLGFAMCGHTNEHGKAKATILKREILLEKPFPAESLSVHVREALG